MMGGVVRLVFGAIVLAGELISSQIGHGAALLYDPTTQIAQGPLATLSGLLASLVFVGTNLHLEVVQIIGHSFERVPPGQVADLIAPGGVWITLAGWVIRAGLQLAGPALALVFLVNVFMGVIGRLAPSMNAFFGLGVILTMIFGELVFTLGMPHALEAHIQMLRESLGSMTEVLRQAAGP
jgi:flagellar biosynthetic protein FliR